MLYVNFPDKKEVLKIKLACGIDIEYRETDNIITIDRNNVADINLRIRDEKHRIVCQTSIIDIFDFASKDLYINAKLSYEKDSLMIFRMDKYCDIIESFINRSFNNYRKCYTINNGDLYYGDNLIKNIKMGYVVCLSSNGLYCITCDIDDVMYSNTGNISVVKKTLSLYKETKMIRTDTIRVSTDYRHSYPSVIDFGSNPIAQEYLELIKE